MNPSQPSRQTIDQQPGDTDWIEQFQKDMIHLVDLNIELLEINLVMILSPVIRQMVLDRAKELKDKFLFLAGRQITIDNIGPPLSELERHKAKGKQ